MDICAPAFLTFSHPYPLRLSFYTLVFHVSHIQASHIHTPCGLPFTPLFFTFPTSRLFVASFYNHSLLLSHIHAPFTPSVSHIHALRGFLLQPWSLAFSHPCPAAFLSFYTPVSHIHAPSGFLLQSCFSHSCSWRLLFTTLVSCFLTSMFLWLSFLHLVSHIHAPGGFLLQPWLSELVLDLAAGVREHGHVPRSRNFVPKRGTGTSWNIVPKCGGTRIIYRSNHRNVSPKRLWNFVVCVHTAPCLSVSSR